VNLITPPPIVYSPQPEVGFVDAYLRLYIVSESLNPQRTMSLSLVYSAVHNSRTFSPRI